MRPTSATGRSSACTGCLNNCTAIFLSIAILISGLRVGYSAPTSEEWWDNPCSKSLVRHSRSAEGQQLKRFLLDMKGSVFREIHGLYKTNGNTHFAAGCPQINKTLNFLKSTTSFHAAMQAFYDTLLQFAKFINKLKNTTIKTHGEFDFARRKRIYDNVTGNLRLLICEYNDTLSNQSNKRGKSHDAGKHVARSHASNVPKIDMSCLKKTMNHTQAHLTDVDFFKKLQKLLRQSRRILRKKKVEDKRNKKKKLRKTRN